MKHSFLSHLLRVISVAALAALALPHPTAAQSSGLTYTVRSGDYLSSIAADFHTTVTRLLLANNIPDPNVLSAGTVLVIPGFEDVQGEAIPVTLPAFETVQTFNQRTRVPDALMNRINFITSPEALYAGQIYYVIYKDEVPQTEIPLTAGMTDLELAVRQNVNPWLPAVFNDLAATWDLLPNSILFLPADQSPTANTAIPALSSLNVSPTPLKQGKTTEVRATGFGSTTLSGTLGDYSLNFFPASDGSLVALQGIERMLDPGLMPLVITLTNPDGSSYTTQTTLRLRQTDYGVDVPLEVKDEYIDPAVTVPEAEHLRELTTPAPAERQWSSFVAPDPYPDLLTSTFGRLRSFNGSAYIYYHGGLDFVGSPMDPAYAAANGTVVFAGELAVRGNAVIISHGWGVYSGYAHLSEIDVAVGDYVEAGRKIGMVGATGRVSGPHLHFEVYVGGVLVDPSDWLNNYYNSY
jgi:murein DD-endopeptidase MepM/ murein hydrolase activator NlpD